ncbi:unnamed protein product [Arabidopsis thaliana]|uniref:(thale cress) hypothetical protein n=1 Tax=Arabidopsis thaliana TaxID=3702 RepID=A0A7G2DSZ5_ARATH|nr:unnamed protein product [Arabidopsis thaliana]
MEGEVDIAPVPPRREAETGDGVRAPAVVVAESSVGVEAPVSQRLRKRKRKRVRVEEEENDEPELGADANNEEDCGVYGDEDCDAVEEIVGGGENDGDGGLGVEEGVNMAADFPEDVRGDDSCTDADSGDEIWEDDKIPDPLSDEEDDDIEAQMEVRREEEDPEVLLAMGKTYNTPDDFKRALLMYSLKTRYDIALYRSESMVVAAKCSYVGVDGVNCGWKVYCSYEKTKHKMQVRYYVNEHSCVRSGSSKMLKRSSIAFLFDERLRVNPKITKNEMVAEIKREFNLEVTPDQCAKAKTKVLKARHATHNDHFSRIWDYQAEVLKQNPETEFEIETTSGTFIGSKQRFLRCYICFKSQKDSWKGTCRPVIGIDGAFLKWDVKGHLLAAVGRDGDNRIVPIAWAVVEIENDDNWDWFLRQLASSLGLCEMQHLAIISDKQSGLVKAIHSILPQAEHRQCSKHIMDNWKRDSHDMELQRLFWKIARSYTEEEFVNNMEELKRYNLHAHTTLQLTSPITWSRAFFRIGTCCNDNLNNLRFTKRAHLEIEKMIAGAGNCERYMARNNLYQIDVHGVSYYVDMENKTCGCRKWQMVGIPCTHAACVIIGRREKVEDYVSEFYTKVMWRKTYKDGIRPVQGMPLWPRSNRLPVLPPPWRRGNAGRPSNHARRKGRNETASTSNNNKMSRAKRIMTCSNCQQEGHNKQRCKNATVLIPPKRPRGCPRVNQVSSSCVIFLLT